MTEDAVAVGRVGDALPSVGARSPDHSSTQAAQRGRHARPGQAHGARPICYRASITGNRELPVYEWTDPSEKGYLRRRRPQRSEPPRPGLTPAVPGGGPRLPSSRPATRRAGAAAVALERDRLSSSGMRRSEVRLGQVRGEGGVLQPAAVEPGVEAAERAGADAPSRPPRETGPSRGRGQAALCYDYESADLWPP